MFFVEPPYQDWLCVQCKFPPGQFNPYATAAAQVTCFSSRFSMWVAHLSANGQLIVSHTHCQCVGSGFSFLKRGNTRGPRWARRPSVEYVIY
eukprot:COSAG05_NODE_2127_length_3517_cov_17.700995_3_plen_92_part_00